MPCSLRALWSLLLLFSPSTLFARDLMRVPDPMAGGGTEQAVIESADRQLERFWSRYQTSQTHRAALPRPLFVKIAAGAEVEVLSSDSQLMVDSKAGTLSLTCDLTLRVIATHLSRVAIYLPPIRGTTTVSDDQGQLSATDIGGVLDVVLRQAVGSGQSVVLRVARQGQAQCGNGVSSGACGFSSVISWDQTGLASPRIYDQTVGLLEPEQAKLALTVAPGYVAAVSGIEKGVEKHQDGTTTYAYDAAGSQRFAFAVAPYAIGETVLSAPKDRVIRSYLTSGANAAAWRQAAGEILAGHETRLGAFDLQHLNFAEIPDNAGAAYGPLHTVFLPSHNFVGDPTNPLARSTLAHELAHQWFGGFIRPAGVHGAFLNEGFATFAEMVYTAQLASPALGYDYGPVDRRSKRQLYMYAVPKAEDTGPATQAVFQVSDLAYFLIVYYKGALIAQMARHAAGDDQKFFAALRAYRQQHLVKQATVQSLAQSLSQSIAFDYAKFFDRWALQGGFTDYRVAYQRKSVSEGRLVITAEPASYAPLEVEVVALEGVRRRERLMPDANDPASYSLQISEKSEVMGVRVDPDYQHVARHHGILDGEIIYDGDVDGRDLIHLAAAVGEEFIAAPGAAPQLFSEWADVVFDGRVDQRDLDAALNNFGKRVGQ